MKIMIVGASRGLGRALVDGLLGDGHTLIGVSRQRPAGLDAGLGAQLQWIAADLARPVEAVEQIAREAPAGLDAVIYNLGVWEEKAFSDEYAFLDDADEAIVDMVNTNITATILLLKRLVPRLLGSSKPQLILTGSTSGLRQSGRPEVTFSASKFALNGIADALRESFREQGLAVTALQLGYLNTQDGLSVPLADAAARGEGELIPVHDVLTIVRALLSLSNVSFVRELVLPAIRDERF
ncbi:SDR family NAD(P)-dependent oxidoreductase [Janthinobacterium sp. SUN118]|uniref:SDR family NAD(P)-dependent oxidoreductase n=1 Tax=Janthinobacterium sp. SUN118 TaxID=3004100 RepID=UPI0025AFDEFE|nr:SDR family oxidoreductase [Janthinobacterium sp. SUN118]MDN2711728.1 SDR family NAD(P)-dependent oxidoreductase [Janthinobacterium sp. SUN118]